MRRFLVPILLAACPLAARANVTLPALISNNMVIQQNADVPLWGVASPGEKIAISLDDKQVETTADADGKWSCKLPPMAASSKPREMTVKGNNTLTVKNILIGENWLCVGQSNMALQLKSAKDGEEEIKKADYPELRYFITRGTKNPAMPKDLPGQWLVCTPQNADRYGFSAVAYFFGRELQQHLKRPIGLIEHGWGGSYIEQWISAETFNNDPTLADFLPIIAADKEAFPRMQADHEARMQKWQATTQAITATRPAAKAGGGLPYPPKKLLSPDQFYSGIYNGLMPGLKNAALTGIIWYQGESQEGHPEPHTRTFPALIKSFRKDFNRPDLPFLFVQLPNLNEPDTNPNARGTWQYVRESQLAGLTQPNTLMVVTLDVGEAHDVHPKNKVPVGHRLALGAFGAVYHEKMETPYLSPLMESVTIDGAKVTVKFKNADGGLMTTDNAPPKTFALAGADGKYVWAKATIENDSVILTASEIPNPKSVRYAFSLNPQVNLVNKTGLPAGPFRYGEPVDKTPQPYSAWQSYMR